MPDHLVQLALDPILDLPWYVGIPGLMVIAGLVLSALWSILMLRPVKAVTRLFLAILATAILSQGGEAIARLIGGGPPPPG